MSTVTLLLSVYRNRQALDEKAAMTDSVSGLPQLLGGMIIRDWDPRIMRAAT
jgi:hypothetical protein